MGSDLIRDTFEKVNLIRKRLLTSQSWQKSSTYKQRLSSLRRVIMSS